MERVKFPPGWTKMKFINDSHKTETSSILETSQEQDLSCENTIIPQTRIGENQPELSQPSKPCFKSIKILLTNNKRVVDVCRICFCAIPDDNMFKLFEENEETTELKNMLKQVLPELDLEIYENCVICKKCKELLVSSFELKATWLSTEKKLRKIAEKRKSGCEESVILVPVVAKHIPTQKIPSNVSSLPPEDHEEANAVDAEAPLEMEHSSDPENNTDNEETEVSKPSTKIRKKQEKCLCEQCGQLLNSSLIRHQKRHLNAVKKQVLQHSPSICDICGLMCPTLTVLRKHMHTKHRKRSKTPYQCPICKKNISSKCYYEEHVRRIHTKTNNYIQCHLCGKKLAGKNSLREHLKVHEGQKVNTCKICDMKFVLKNNLKKHMVKHSNTMFSCEFCGKSIKHKQNLRRHIKVYHKNEGKNCDVCGRGFEKKQSLINHKIKVHGF